MGAMSRKIDIHCVFFSLPKSILDLGASIGKSHEHLVFRFQTVSIPAVREQYARKCLISLKKTEYVESLFPLQYQALRAWFSPDAHGMCAADGEQTGPDWLGD